MYMNGMDSVRMGDARSERRIVENRMRRQREMRKNFYIFVMTVCLIITCSVSLSVFRSNAKDDDVEYPNKYYKSINVSEQDTLWSIALEHMDWEHYASVNDYIAEVKSMNCLDNDDIYYGEYLVIPYYGE